MQYALTPYAEFIEPFGWWADAFTNQELDWLQEQAAKSNNRGLIGGNESLFEVRRSYVSWLKCDEKTVWIFHRLSHVISSLNSQLYRFDLTGFGEELQLTNYDQSENGMYGWHQDYGGGRSISRKLSLVLQLTDPAFYEGGNLQIKVTGKPINIPKQRGLIVVFPSYQLHQVTPVTQGSRQSLVAWISGPAFK